MLQVLFVVVCVAKAVHMREVVLEVSSAEGYCLYVSMKVIKIYIDSDSSSLYYAAAVVLAAFAATYNFAVRQMLVSFSKI